MTDFFNNNNLILFVLNISIIEGKHITGTPLIHIEIKL